MFLQLAYRDLHQLADYLRGMVKESFNEQRASEQLICQLLNTTKQFYVQLRASNQCTPEMEKYFEVSCPFNTFYTFV